MIRILHISDLHWHNNSKDDFRIIWDALIEDVNYVFNNIIKHKLDIVIFSGDLVRSGENEQDFDLAYEDFILPLLNNFSIENEQFIICAGNHDISRSTVRSSQILEEGLRSSLSNVYSVNAFIDKFESNDELSLLALSRMRNYENFLTRIGYISDHYNSMFHVKRFKLTIYL